MIVNVTAVERAFELASSGRFFTVSELRYRLGQEGYNQDHVQGPSLCKQLSALMEKARAPHGAREKPAARKKSSLPE